LKMTSEEKVLTPGEAWKHLSKALQDDEGYAWSWH
jgi:hypothetical protein